MRSDRIRLAADVSRCEPSAGCDRRERCARAMASIPSMGSMADFSLARAMYLPCAYFVRIEDGASRGTAREVQPVKPWPQST